MVEGLAKGLEGPVSVVEVLVLVVAVLVSGSVVVVLP